MKFKRILLKLSGESLAGESGFGIDPSKCQKVAEVIKKCTDFGVQMGIVIGAGNFWRGRTGTHISRTESDKIGILATAMNAIAFSDVLNKNGVKSCVQSALEIKGLVPEFSVSESLCALDEKKVVIFSCGIGAPFFSTDTAAALRAAEIEADAILKATTVDGVYSSDPKIDKSAIKYEDISFDEILNKNLKFMDMTAISLCRDCSIPVVVFNFKEIYEVISGEKSGTYVHN